MSAMMLAIKKNHLTIVQMLQEAGVDMTERTPDGTDLLYLAASLGHEQVVSYLIGYIEPNNKHELNE